MKLYRYHGWHAQQYMRGCIIGRSKKQVLKILEHQGLGKIVLKRYWGTMPRIADMELFFLYLGYGLKAGYPLANALLLVVQGVHAPLSDIARALYHLLAQGSLFSSACQSFSKIFPQTVITLLKVAEESGRLIHGCEQAQLYFSQQQKHRYSWIKALS
jgi:type II secretory pathway component PulF